MNERTLIALNDLIKTHNFKDHEHLFIGYENGSGQWEDLVVYSTSDMLEQPSNFEEFLSIVEENALYIEDFEIDRFSI